MKITRDTEYIAFPSTHIKSATSAHQQQSHQYNNNYSKNAKFNSTSASVKVSLLLLIVFSASMLCEGSDNSVGDIGIGTAIGTGILKRSRTQHQALPECIDDQSVCGYVQLNNMGISSQPICKCRGGVQCPMMWHPMDGRTVSHGTDQYKYCSRAPNLKHCTKDESVYTTYLETSMLTMKTLLNTNHIHCLCPAFHLFVRNSTKFHDLDETTAVIGTSYQCKPPPVCGLEDACMAITESAHSSFITRNCICPIGMFCPNDIRLAAERVDLNRGAYYIMNCI